MRGVCLDIDDTLSTEGKLTAQAFSALWALHEAGLLVVPITGRPAGWCDHIVRFWPVHAVVGENGAFTFFMNKGKRQRLDTPTGLPEETRKKKLIQLSQKILKTFPQARWASDQAYREFDLAIDFCEDVPAWKPAQVQRLLTLCHDEGAHAKLSSIHVNTWYGNYDKQTGFKKWTQSGYPGTPHKIQTDEWLFIGDSPNDEPLFQFFKYSVGVANLAQFLPTLQHPPRWITPSKSGVGFTEMTQQLLKSRN